MDSIHNNGTRDEDTLAFFFGGLGRSAIMGTIGGVSFYFIEQLVATMPHAIEQIPDIHDYLLAGNVGVLLAVGHTGKAV